MTGLIGKGEIVNWQEADVCLIPSASMISKELFYEIKEAGKKIVLRVDNIPRNSRNRGTGTSRLKMMADRSDLIIYQSQWSKDYVGYFLGKDGEVIYNGIDLGIFNDKGREEHQIPTYLYSRFNRDETKRWEWAWYKYQLIHRQSVDCQLLIVGRFSPEQIEYNFDFYNREHISYLGVVDNDEEMAKIYRRCDYLLATYSNDCYSNTYQEALACGVKLYEPDMSGGTPELIKNGALSCQSMVEKYLEVFDRLKNSK